MDSKKTPKYYYLVCQETGLLFKTLKLIHFESSLEAANRLADTIPNSKVFKQIGDGPIEEVPEVAVTFN